MSSKIVFLASASLTVLVYSIAYERFKRSFTITRSRIRGYWLGKSSIELLVKCGVSMATMAV